MLVMSDLASPRYCFSSSLGSSIVHQILWLAYVCMCTFIYVYVNHSFLGSIQSIIFIIIIILLCYYYINKYLNVSFVHLGFWDYKQNPRSRNFCYSRFRFWPRLLSQLKKCIIFDLDMAFSYLRKAQFCYKHSFFKDVSECFLNVLNQNTLLVCLFQSRFLCFTSLKS